MPKSRYTHQAMTIALDLDGTLLHYDHWRGHEHFGAPLDGAVVFVEWLHNQGHELWIYTARATEAVGQDAVMAWLRTSPFAPYIVGAVGLKMGMFDLFIDDRALPFRGNFGEVQDQVKTFRQWWREPQQRREA